MERGIVFLKVGFAVFALILLMPCTDTKAGMIGTDNAVGGVGQAIEAFVSANGRGIIDDEELEVLSAAMELENGCNSDLCLLYTGSVIINRRNKKWADTFRGVIYQGYHNDGYCQQYASRTVENLDSVVVSERVRLLAMRLLIKGPIDSEVVYQSMNPNLGRNAFQIDTDWFAYD